MQTELLSLSKAFNEYLYRIPDYQRGYSWGPKQLKDFWNDLEQLEYGHKHYTGVLTLEAVPRSTYQTWEDDLWIIESKNFKPYYVVDGQQRLTTSIILIQAILDFTPEGKTLNYDSVEEIRKRFIFLTRDGGVSRSYIFGYEKDNPSYEFLKTKIFKEESNNHEGVEDTIYTSNLLAARAFFDEKLKCMAFPELEKIFTQVSQNMLFNVFTISEDIDVFVTFETMNNRGKPLSHLELLKNRLIYLSTKFSSEQLEEKHDRSRLRKTINECWKSAYHYIGRNPQRKLDDNEFLLLQFFLYFNIDLPQRKHLGREDSLALYRFQHHDRYKDYLLEDVFNVKLLYDTRPGTSEHFKRENSNIDSLEESADLDADDTKVAPKKPLSVSAINDFALDIKKTVQICYDTQNPGGSGFSDEEKVLLERIRRMPFFEASVLVVAIYKKSNTRKERISLLEALERTLFLRSISRWSFNELELLEEAVWYTAGSKSISAVTNRLHDACETFVKAKDFRDGIRDLGKASGYYGWSAIRYFLFEYEQELLQGSKTSRVKLDWEDFVREVFQDDYVTIEHIYPQKGAKLYWDEDFSSCTIKQKNSLKHSLGNLVPLSKKKNSSLGNRSFEEKKGNRVKKTGYLYGCYSEIEVAHETTWTPRHIADRGVHLLKFMERRWKLKLGPDAEKLEILGLEFVSNLELTGEKTDS